MAREMKDSGIEWIGEIPREWYLIRMKACILQRDSGAWGNEANGNEGDIICLRIADFDYPKFKFKDTDEELLTKRNYNISIIENLLLHKNDIVIEKSGGGEKTPVGRTVIFDKSYRAVYANFCDRLRCREIILPQFMQYIFVTFYTNRYIWNYIKQTTGIQNLDLTAMLDSERIALPSTIEQQRIVNSINTYCTELDNVFEKTRKSIEEYKKLKQAVITQAVTKGIRGDRAMKDSGIEWIGEIPEEWYVKKLRYLGRCQNGISKSSEYFGVGYPFVSYGDVYRNYQLPEMVTGLIMSTDSDRKNYSVIRGDVLFTRTSETIEEVGFSSVCLKTIECATFAGFVIRFRPHGNELLPEYSKYYFRSDIHRRFFVKEMNLVTRASLGQELLKKLPVILPSLKEQEEIVNYLDQKCSAIDELITKKEQYLSEIENYKKSLIYEYVTGKREVPCEAI